MICKQSKHKKGTTEGIFSLFKNDWKITAKIHFQQILKITLTLFCITNLTSTKDVSKTVQCQPKAKTINFIILYRRDMLYFLLFANALFELQMSFIVHLMQTTSLSRSELSFSLSFIRYENASTNTNTAPLSPQKIPRWNHSDAIHNLICWRRYVAFISILAECHSFGFRL